MARQAEFYREETARRAKTLTKALAWGVYILVGIFIILAIFQLAGKVLTEAQKKELAKSYEEEFAKFRLDKVPISSAEAD